MTNEEIMTLDLEAVETRMSEIKSLVADKSSEADFDALSVEVDALEARKAVIADEQRKADTAAVIAGEGEETTITLPTEERHMQTLKELRSSKEYMDAFAEYIKNGDATEVRMLLSKNAESDGQISVPTIVETKIRTAWEKSDLFSRVGKSEIKGNLAIDFEISGTDAVIHEEGDDAPDEEELELGTVTLVPKNIKKWISVSDEVMDLRGEAFLDYVYDELAYKIVKKAEHVVVAKIVAAVGASTSTRPGQASVYAEIGRAGVVNAISNISDEAEDLCIIMNRRTWGQYEATRTLNTLDPFADLPVVYDSSLDAYDVAEDGKPYAIVGDLGFGTRANLPNGFNVKTVVNEDGPADKVKITGKLFAALDVIAVNAFCAILKGDVPES
jgi:HK97 family phage major capsid protein